MIDDADILLDDRPVSGAEETADLVEERAEPRYVARIRAALLLNGRNLELFSDNVSYRGLFLRSNDPVPARQLVRLRLVLPPYDEVLTTPAMVVHSVESSGAFEDAPGFGVRFVGLDGEPRERWARFLRHVEELAATGRTSDVGEDPANADLTPYRPLVDLPLNVATVANLEALITQEISRGRVLIPFDVPIAESTPVRVHLIHPLTADAFILDGTVSRWSRGTVRGLATVDLVRLTYDMHRALSEFASGICIESDIDVTVEDLDKTREAPVYADDDVMALLRQSTESKTKMIPAHRLEELCDELRASERPTLELRIDPSADAFDDITTT